MICTAICALELQRVITAKLLKSPFFFKSCAPIGMAWVSHGAACALVEDTLLRLQHWRRHRARRRGSCVSLATLPLSQCAVHALQPQK